MNTRTRKRIEQTGACAGSPDHHLWISDLPKDQDKAKSICQGCPLREECYQEYFWESGIVVGGTSWKERRQKAANLDLPYLSKDRLLDSYARGGLRAIMLECSLDEEQATHTVRLLKKLGAK